MPLRKKLIGLAGTLMLAASPTAIVLVQDALAQTALAQDAQAPGAEAPAPAKPSIEDVIKRRKKAAGQDGEGAPAGQRAAPADSQGQDDGAPAVRPKRQKPTAEPDAAPGGEELPAAKPKRQKQSPEAGGQAMPGDEAPAAKPRRQKQAPGADGQEAPAGKPMPEGGPSAPAAKPAMPVQPTDEQGGAPAQPNGKRRDRSQSQPGAADETGPGQAGGPPQNGGRNALPGQGGMPLPAPLPLPQPGEGQQPGQGRPLQGQVDQAAEQRAIGLLADTTPPDRLDEQQLRRRLDVYRSALAAGNLSDVTEQALIRRLDGARAALRNRVAGQEYGAGQPDQSGRNAPFGRSQFRLGSPRPQDVPAILADRRPSNVLTVDQLNRRILVYRDAANDQRYSPEDREAFAQYLRDDRNDLRRRLLSDRGQRTDRLRRYEGDRRFDMDIVPRGQRPQSVWAAEVGDEQIEEQFAARPLRPLPRRYARSEFLAQPEAVMEQPAVRQSIPGVELDTIHFGFNESFVREEEIANLDRIGRILERIVAAHPGEVFVIEGNTDAVGDDAYNLRLSKERAEAVKQALTQYYVIAPENLVTAGLGERYLKIPTPEPEQENRRVTIRRVTPLLQN